MKRRVEPTRIKEWADDIGGSKYAVDRIMGVCENISHHTAYRIVSGQYISEPRVTWRRAICALTGFKEDELFPVTEETAS